MKQTEQNRDKTLPKFFIRDETSSKVLCETESLSTFSLETETRPRLYLEPMFLDPKFFGPHIFLNNQFFRPKIFLDPKSIRIHNSCGWWCFFAKSFLCQTELQLRLSWAIGKKILIGNILGPNIFLNSKILTKLNC